MGTNKNIEHNEDEQGLPVKQNSFSAPSDYFDTLPVEIMDKIHSSAKQKKAFSILNPSFAVTSLALLSGMIALLIFLKTNASSSEIMLSENDIEHVVQNPESYNIDEDAIIEKYLSSTIELTEDNPVISDDDIKNFLEESSDINNIINEY